MALAGPANLRWRPYSSTLPAGVSLTEIDGGSTYYATNGWTYATDTTYHPSWDDRDFFPVGLFLEKFRSQSDANKWAELGCNVAISVQGDVDIGLLDTNGISLVIQEGEYRIDGGNNLYQATLTSSTVGFYAQDEPDNMTVAHAGIVNVSNADQANRPWVVTFTHNQVTYGDIGGVSMPTVMTQTSNTPSNVPRRLEIPFLDQYFFCGSYASAWRTNAGNTFNLGRDMTAEEMRRGCRYGDTVDFIRFGGGGGGNSAWCSPRRPTGIFVETGTCYNETTTEGTAILPDEINAAVWSTLIHGARFVLYFTLGDGSSWNSGGLIGQTFWDTAYNTAKQTARTGTTISNYDQVAATNALIADMATVLNSPFAEGFVTVSPAAVKITSSVDDSGIDVMAKYHESRVDGYGDNKFYIFAMPRANGGTWSGSAWTGADTNISATFTIKDTGASTVTVIGEDRTISITNGGTQFVDTFATAHTVHIYRVG